MDKTNIYSGLPVDSLKSNAIYFDKTHNYIEGAKVASAILNLIEPIRRKESIAEGWAALAARNPKC